ncbi:MAG: S1C family serine protease [Thermoguttaceae bacterium]|jgi:S1-C subfamily serine protease
MAHRQILMLCVLSAAVGALTAVYVTRDPDPAKETRAQEKASSPPAPTQLIPLSPPPPPSYEGLTEDEKVNIRVYESVNRSVVNISTRSVQGDGFFMFAVPSEGAGSGVVIDKQGRIVTNFHVIEDARQIQVTLFDGKSYDAQVVGVDSTTDVAVLQIEAPQDSLFPVRFGNSSDLLVGQRVYAIGNPFGLQRTLSTGIISSLNRQLPSPRRYRRIDQMIQIDANINPGNSGGPLLDTSGRMIGMNQAIASTTQESAGIGFAIPVNTIARIVPQLIAKGRVVRANIGIESVSQMDHGLLIVQLTPGGAAERAGLQGPRVERRRVRQGQYVWEQTVLNRSAADVIIGVEGKPIETVEEFLAAVESRQPGEKVIVNVIREDRQIAVPVVLDADE